jgi:hypothetical protein
MYEITIQLLSIRQYAIIKDVPTALAEVNRARRVPSADAQISEFQLHSSPYFI